MTSAEQCAQCDFGIKVGYQGNQVEHDLAKYPRSKQ